MEKKIKEILNSHGIGGKLEENTTKDLVELFKSKIEHEKKEAHKQGKLDLYQEFEGYI